MGEEGGSDVPKLEIVDFLLVNQRRGKKKKKQLTNKSPYYLSSVSCQENPVSLPLTVVEGRTKVSS